MKMNHLFNTALILPFAALLFNCNSVTKNENAISLGSTNLQVNFPEKYKQYSLTDIENKIASTDSTKLINILHAYKMQIEQNSTNVILVDTINYFNHIVIKKGPKVLLDKNSTQELSDKYKKEILKTISFLDGKIRIEERAVKNGENRYMKLRFKVSFLDGVYYQTFYILNNGIKSYGVIVINNTGEDYEDAIAKLKFH